VQQWLCTAQTYVGTCNGTRPWTVRSACSPCIHWSQAQERKVLLGFHAKCLCLSDCQTPLRSRYRQIPAHIPRQADAAPPTKQQSLASAAHTCCSIRDFTVTETNRVELVLLGMQDRTIGPYFTATHGTLILCDVAVGQQVPDCATRRTGLLDSWSVWKPHSRTPHPSDGPDIFLNPKHFQGLPTVVARSTPPDPNPKP
jgi:hypothetical protein